MSRGPATREDGRAGSQREKGELLKDVSSRKWTSRILRKKEKGKGGERGEMVDREKNYRFPPGAQFEVTGRAGLD